MVVYGYGIDINEQDRFEGETLALERERIYKTLNGEDRRILVNILESMSRKNIYPAGYFVDEITWRIYTEWCMNSKEKGNPDNYKGKAFNKFIDDETYYTIGRLNRYISDDESKKIRFKVFEGLIKRADEFFYKGNREENLRCNLEKYIDL